MSMIHTGPNTTLPSIRWFKSSPSDHDRRTVRWPEPGTPFLWTLRIVTITALAVTGYLAWVTLTSGKVAGCGSGGTFDCSHVLTSRWSTVAGIPVGVPAVILYSVVLALLCTPKSFSRIETLRWSGISFAAFTAGLVAIWFVSLQVFWVQHLCMYCLVAHTCGIVLACLLLYKSPAGRRTTRVAAAAAVVATMGLVGAQLLVAPPETFEVIDHESRKEVDSQIFEAPISVVPALATELEGLTSLVQQMPHAALGFLNPSLLFVNQVRPTRDQKSVDQANTDKHRKTATILNHIELDVLRWPLLGSPEADHVFVEMLDYTCSHCRATHGAVRATLESFDNQLAVIVLPVPLDRSCNPHARNSGGPHAEACALAKLAIAVWHLDPTQFAEFHHWLLTTPPNQTAARTYAAKLVGEEQLMKELSSETPSAYVAKNVELYRRAGAGTIPKMLFPKTTSVGEITSTDNLKSLVRQHVIQ